MYRLYSKTTQTTYVPGLHVSIPEDAIEISDALYLAVIGNPAPGKIRAHDERGLPYLVDAPVVERDLSVEERIWRDADLTSVMWLRERHRDQLEIGTATTLTGEQFKELLVYMQSLRDWPQSPDFPQAEYRPVAPSWIAEQTQ
ncbi:phage tail assembly chaperone [Pseudomonas protegens]|uniref:phage tail assembly chaperone n=1 Tax=Pseudomonas protegens TaxID=380021 RepID=UPI001C8E1BD4|nr:phage tail assembly chaperone [Pseudomonas protegens]QZI69556.1 phage tail assembly chaperone [Pseudomonas protegens]